MHDLADLTLALAIEAAPLAVLPPAYGWSGLCIVDRCAGRATPTGLCDGHDDRMAHVASVERADRAALEQWTPQDAARHNKRLERGAW